MHRKGLWHRRLSGCGLAEAVKKPCVLLGFGHGAVVEHDGVGSLSERRCLSMAVEIVAFLDVLQHFMVVGSHSFGGELVITAFLALSTMLSGQLKLGQPL